MDNRCISVAKDELAFNKRVLSEMNRDLGRLNGLGKGCLVYKERRGRKEFYLKWRENGKAHYQYLGKEINQLIKKYQRKRYLETAIPLCENNIFVLQSLIDEYQSIRPEALLPTLSKACQKADFIRDLYFESKSATAWKIEKLKKKAQYAPYMTNSLKQNMGNGDKVRSKSEAIIYEILTMMNITFVYEMPMNLGGKWVCPDFLLYVPETGEEIIYEHFGMMGEDGYRQENQDKMYLYWANGYMQNVNFICTFDDPNGGINIQGIYNALAPWFGSMKASA